MGQASGFPVPFLIIGKGTATILLTRSLGGCPIWLKFFSALAAGQGLVDFDLNGQIQPCGQISGGDAVETAEDRETIVIALIPDLSDALGAIRHDGNQAAIGIKGPVPGVAPYLLIVNVADDNFDELAGRITQTYRIVSDIGFVEHDLYRLIRAIDPGIVIVSVSFWY